MRQVSSPLGKMNQLIPVDSAILSSRPDKPSEGLSTG